MISVSEAAEMRRDEYNGQRSVFPQIAEAVTPQEASGVNDAEDAKWINDTVVRINIQLKAAYRSGGVVTVDASSMSRNEKCNEAVKSAFQKKGWKIKYISDQRDGSYYEFSA